MKKQKAKTQRTNSSDQKSAGSGRKRPPLTRMRKIIEQLKAGKYPNCTSIAAEFGVSVKTAARDMDFLRDSWEMPIAYDERKFGFYLTKPPERFPGVAVTERELFALCVAHKAVEQYQGTALQQPLELAFEKCMAQLDDEERFTLQNLDEVLSFRPFAPEDADLRLFELITEAIRKRRALEFVYRKPGDKVGELRRVNPYHLMQFSNRWYLIAEPRDSFAASARRTQAKAGATPSSDLVADVAKGTAIRKFVLGRMQGTRMTEDPFKVPADFNPKKFFEHSLGVMTGAGDYEVVIELDAWLTDVHRGRRWHPSQVWTELPGGGSHLRMRLSCLEEIEQWVLSWGTHATVLQPVELRERMFKITEDLWQRYGNTSVLHESKLPCG